MVTRCSSLLKLFCVLLLVICGVSFARESRGQKIIVLDDNRPLDYQADQRHPLPTTSLLEEISSKGTLLLTIKEKIGNLRDLLTETLGEDNHRDEKGYLPQFSYIYDLFFDDVGKQKRDRLRLLLSKANVTFALFDKDDVQDLEKLSISYQNGLCVPGFSLSLWKRCYAPPTNCSSVQELISSLIGDIRTLDSIDREKIGISFQKNNLSLRFLTDHIPLSGRSTPNQDIQLKLIDRGYEVLKEIREGRVTHKDEPVIFTADFIKMYSSWWSFFCPQTTLGATLSLLTWSNHKKETLFRRAYLEDIVALQWAVTNEAYLKGYFFKSGSFTFIDNDLKFYKYFEDYIKCASGITDLVDLPWGIFNLGSLNTRSYFVYDRSLLSSHYKQKSLSQSGIDIRFESNQYVVPVLPYGMAHLIVGRIAAPDQKIVTFLKPELQGLGDWYNAWLHGKDYFSYEISGGPKGNSEKTVPQNVLKAFCDLFDHIPEEDKSSIPRLSEAFNLTKEVKSKSSSGEYNFKNLRSSKLSVSQIFHFLRAIYAKYKNIFEKERYDIDNPKTLQDFTYVLAHSLQMWSNLSSRSGSEVIFDFDKGMTELKEELFPSRNKMDAISLIPFDEKKKYSTHDLQLSSIIQDLDLADNHQRQFAAQSFKWRLRKVKRSKSTPLIRDLELRCMYSSGDVEQDSPVISKRTFLIPSKKSLPQKPLYSVLSVTPQRTALLSSIRETGGGQGTQFLRKVDLTEILRKKEEEKQKREMFKRQITSGSQLHKVDHVEVRKAKEKANEQRKKEAGPTLLDQIVKGTTLRKTPKS